MKMLLVAFLSLGFSTTVFAKEDLTHKMMSACKSELAQSPAETSKDGESIWKNLEEKEQANMKISKKCHAAHEKYEAKHHKGMEEHETK